MMSDLPEPLRRRMAELDGMAPLETVRAFLRGEVADAESLDEIRAGLRGLAQVTTRGIRHDLTALEALLAEPPPEPGALARLVAADGNWVLDEFSEERAARFLGELAALLRSVLDEVEPSRS
ncbi:hypothetical protein AB0M20_40105 [Actinoplanes sp. NPDC051633]|uniref:hypothetical protein n=1 Tax=Actinoplanes sp. NPDC051633 TaxID=3155670 RepID=UPI003437E202